MTKAYFFDSLCGSVYRCMFAGLDENGHAQWVNITPGEEARTLDDMVIDEDLGETRFKLLSLEGELAQPEIIAKVLGRVMECPIDELSKDFVCSIRQMKQLGVMWDKEPLTLEIRVFENSIKSDRQGKYSFWVQDKKGIFTILADIDGFSELDVLFEWIRTYLMSLEKNAEIPIVAKVLRIDNRLRREVSENDLEMFNHIIKE